MTQIQVADAVVTQGKETVPVVASWSGFVEGEVFVSHINADLPAAWKLAHRAPCKQTERDNKISSTRPRVAIAISV